MAFARLLFRVLLILLILLAVIGMMLPSSAKIERSILVNAPASEIFPHLNGMRAFHAWSPWSEIDPETNYRFEGPEQGIGSRISWNSGHEQVGLGSQEVVDSVRNQRVEMQLEFGDKGKGKATFLLEPEGTATRIRWQFHTEFGWDLFGRYVGLMLDSMIGMSYEKGLNTLKARIEKIPASQTQGGTKHGRANRQ